MLRPFDFAMIGVLIAGATWTYKVKHDSEIALDKVREIERKIASEKQEIKLLKADWALVTSPERLEQLVKKYEEQLQLKHLDPGQIATARNLPPIKVPERERKDDFAENGELQILDEQPTGSVDLDSSEPTFAPIEEGLDQ